MSAVATAAHTLEEEFVQWDATTSEFRGAVWKHREQTSHPTRWLCPPQLYPDS